VRLPIDRREVLRLRGPTFAKSANGRQKSARSAQNDGVAFDVTSSWLVRVGRKGYTQQPLCNIPGGPHVASF
jgi:hypothetical protein